MKVKWLGHASFLISANDGTTIITDPYGNFAGLNYEPITESADIVLVSHDHGDHAGGKVGGNPQAINRAGSVTVKGIDVTGVAGYHDSSGGKERGKNIMFCFIVDSVRVCHLGDLGHALSEQQVKEIGKVDILMIPVGGNYTIDARQAAQVCDQLKPKVIIPMHVSNDKCAFPIATVDEFLTGKTNVEKVSSAEKEFNKEALPPSTKIVVLQHAK